MSDFNRMTIVAAAEVIAAPIVELVERVDPDADTLAVIMTHHYVHDTPLVRELLPRRLAYLGLLGPRKRAEKILQDLAQGGLSVTPDLRERLHAPVGLDLGADGPEQVALAIVAEMQATLALVRAAGLELVAALRKPLRLESPLAGMERHVSCNCALHAAMKNMRSITVFGVRNERDNQDALYIAMHPKGSRRAKCDEYFAFLVNSVVSQIDVAFRKVAALKRPCTEAPASIPLSLGQFSEREHEVLHWLAQGKCNSEIAEKLNISAFTVKNHVQRIYKKLAAGNRTEAAEKYRLLNA